MFALTVPLVFRHYLIVKKVTCGDTEIDSIIDTGTGVSVILPELCNHLKLESSRWEGRFLILANGEKVNP